MDGGEQEGDGDMLAESDEVTYECGARQKYPILFEVGFQFSFVYLLSTRKSFRREI